MYFVCWSVRVFHTEGYLQAMQHTHNTGEIPSAKQSLKQKKQINSIIIRIHATCSVMRSSMIIS